MSLETIYSIMPFLLKGLAVTFKISMITIFSGSLLGLVLALLRTLNYRFLTIPITIYTHLLRGTPFIVHLYVVYFILPSTGISWLKLDGFTAAIIALSLYTSTYVAEIVRSAIDAVPRGQAEAAKSIGMNKFQSMYYVIFPQAVKMMIPPMGGVYVMIIKGTSIVSVIGISELVRAGSNASQRYPGDLISIYILTALMYFAYCYPVLRFSKWVENKYGGVKVRI